MSPFESKDLSRFGACVEVTDEELTLEELLNVLTKDGESKDYWWTKNPENPKEGWLYHGPTDTWYIIRVIEAKLEIGRAHV